MVHDTFISYDVQDKAVAVSVCNALEEAKIKCWIAPRDIRSEDNWAKAINEAIKSSRTFILIFSESSNRSQQIAKELTLAINYTVTIIPFQIDDILPSGVMAYYLSSTHWIDGKNPPGETQINNLVKIVSMFNNQK